MFKALLLLSMLGSPALAQTATYGPITAETKYGKIIFTEVALWQRSELTKRVVPWFSAVIENRTGTTWHIAEFDAILRCPGAQADVKYKVVIPAIASGTDSFRFKEPYPQPATVLPCDPDTLSMSMTGGWSDREREDREQLRKMQLEATLAAERAAKEEVAREEAETERKRIAAQRAADQKARAKREAEDKARREYLAKFPILDSGAQAVFVGADRKCSEQFVQALSMEGLEKRKRLADLVSYGCGFIEDSNVHAMRLQAEGSYCQVRLVNGEHPSESGWVPCSWVK